jgi:hypothetical protein
VHVSCSASSASAILHIRYPIFAVLVVRSYVGLLYSIAYSMTSDNPISGIRLSKAIQCVIQQWFCPVLSAVSSRQ